MSEERALERAEELAEVHKKNAISAIRNQVPPDRMGPAECECGESIHIDRRMLGYKNCIFCASEAEQKAKHYARHQ